MFLKKWNSCNICVPCIVRPLLFSLLIRANCRHSNMQPFSLPFEIKDKKLFAFVLISLYVLEFIFGFIFNLCLLRSVCTRNEANCLSILSNTILIFAGLWICSALLLYLNSWLEEANKWSYAFDDLVNQRSVINDLEKFTETYFQRSILTLFVIFFQFISLLVICIISMSGKELFEIASEIALLVISCLQVAVFTILSVLTQIIKNIIRICGVYFCNTLKNGQVLGKNIQEYHSLVCSATTTWRKLDVTLNYSAMVCMICYISMMILNVFSLITGSNINNLKNVIISCYRVASVSFILIYTNTALDQENMVSINFYEYDKLNKIQIFILI